MLQKLKNFFFPKPGPETVAQEALRLLAPIPAEAFIAGQFGNSEGKCCAIGHYVRLKSKNPNDFTEDNCRDFGTEWVKLRVESGVFLKKVHSLQGYDLPDVNNDSDINGYTEPVIKDRVIHCLKDMVKAGY